MDHTGERLDARGRVRGYYHDVGEHYEVLKGEQVRLGEILDSQSEENS